MLAHLLPRKPAEGQASQCPLFIYFFEMVFSDFSLVRCEIKIVPGSFKNLYQDNEICDLTIA